MRSLSGDRHLLDEERSFFCAAGITHSLASPHGPSAPRRQQGLPETSHSPRAGPTDAPRGFSSAAQLQSCLPGWDAAEAGVQDIPGCQGLFLLSPGCH